MKLGKGFNFAPHELETVNCADKSPWEAYINYFLLVKKIV